MTAVEVWQLRLTSDTDVHRDALKVLDAQERRAVDRYRNAEDRAARVQTRALLRTVLARAQGCDPRAVEITETEAGKPVLADPTGPRFSVAHSRTLAVVATCTTTELGVDVEPRRDLVWREVAERFLAPAEIAAIEEQPPDARLDAFYATWVRKEAYLKGIGTGFTAVSDGFEVPLAEGFVRDPTRRATAWFLHGLDLDAGHAAALAVAGGPATVSVRHARRL